jgi:hypothetical protein
MIGTSRLRILIAFAVVAMCSPVRAQPAEAEVLFREGKHQLAAGDLASACASLDASERLDPAIGTELNLADCLDRSGKPASAWAMFTKAEQSAKHIGDTKRGAEAHRRATELVPKLVYLTIVVSADHQIDGLEIARDAMPVARVLWNQRIVLDPGNYQIAAAAPGHLTWRTTVALAENRTIEVPMLQAAALENPFPDEAPTEPKDEPEREVSAPPVAKPRRYTAASLTLGVIGAATIAAGASFGYFSQELEARSDNACHAAACTDPLGVGESQRARRDALVADSAFVVGGVMLVTAATSWLLGRPTHVERLTVVPLARGAGLAVGGRL